MNFWINLFPEVKDKKILLYGYGNPGRQDDGLGVFLAQMVEEWARETDQSNIRVETNYQLNIEDAAEISSEDLVIFTDASTVPSESFLFESLRPSAQVEFTMHSVHPAFVLHLCDSIYNKTPEAWLFHIKGEQWEMGEGLSSSGEKNLQMAFEFIKDYLGK